ncbi:MAG: Mini-circle protein [Candidatus Aeolococcus gillhamiae]|uniref:Mini-circle protein n=1 Tax=Candidatus Aeolococcus gillhamiae TaxID=3127015 RepID=A0A2W5ZWT6_9BACT|nr:MAG: Mini-circle protein [Candidatus Dormibacter sp. RRmetagenome_bin12]
MWRVSARWQDVIVPGIVAFVLRPSLPDPPTAADEKTTLVAFLDWYRDCLLRKVEGLDREALTRRLVPSATTLLGIVKHLAYVERGWFQNTFLGQTRYRPPRSAADDAEFSIEDAETVDSIITLYRDEVARSREIVAGAALDDHARREDRSDYTLRWIMVHMIEETARHVGHADILREQTDGAAGE